MDKLVKKISIMATGVSALTVILIPLMTFIYGKTKGEILRNGIFALAFILGLVFFVFYTYHLNGFDYDNQEHPYRFLIAYSIALLLCVLFPLVDVGGWIYLGIGIGLALFSNSYIAMYVTPGLILFSMLLKNETDLSVFIVYYLSSFIGIMLFRDIDQNFKVGHSIFISVFCLFVLETGGLVMLKNEELNAEQFIIPIVNVFINVIVIFGGLKFFNEYIINRYRNRYLEINDQDYHVLIELKDKSKKEYFRTIHTAYLVERIAPKVACNVDIAKSLAYYHRVKTVFGMSGTASEKFIADNGFPPECAKALLSYWSKKNQFNTKEEGITYVCDMMIFTLQSLFEKDKNVKIDYSELYDNLMNKSFMVSALSDSDLSVKDFKIMKEIITGEKLYYDFLR